MYVCLKDPSSDDEGATRVRVNEPIVAGHTTLSDREHVRTPVQVSRTASNIRTPRDGIRRNEERDFRTGPSRTHNKEPSHSTPSSTRSVGRNKTSHDARNEEKESGRGNREPSSSRVLHLEMSGSEEVSTNTSGDEYPTPTEDTSVVEEDQVCIYIQVYVIQYICMYNVFLHRGSHSRRLPCH